MMTTYNKTDKSAYVALGMIFGIVAGMLLAPRSGEELRATIREKGMAAKRKAGEQLSEKGKTAMQTINKTLDKSQNMAEHAGGQAQETADRLTTGGRNAMSEAQEQTQAARRRGGANG